MTGLFVFASLIIILSVFHEAQEMMFRITPLAFAGSLTGHLIYGLSLGLMAKRFFAKEKPGPGLRFAGQKKYRIFAT